MKIRLMDLNSPILVDRGLRLEGKKVLLLNGSFVYTKTDFCRIMEAVQKIWSRISLVNKDFVGLIRFDLIPGLWFDYQYQELEEEINLGPLYVRGIYEINVHFPECAAAISASHEVAPDLAKVQPNAAGRLARAIRQTFGDREIVFVPGNGPVKRSWGEVFFRELLKTGLKIIRSTPEELVMEPPSSDSVIWRGGDIRIYGGYTEYNLPFAEFIILWQKRGTVFNTVPSSAEVDLGNKKWLMPGGGKDREWDSLVGSNFSLTDISFERLELAKRNKEVLVIKPLLGSSGLDITFGRLVSQEEWEKKLMESIGQPYGLFQARWLPKVVIGGAPYAIDLNVACWVNRGNLRYLYSIIRMDEWSRYWKRGVINVARGGAIGGSPIEDGL